MAAFFSLGTPGSSGSQNRRSDEEDQQHHQYHQIYHHNNNNNTTITNWASLNPTNISLYRPIPSPNPSPSPTRGFQLWQPFVEVNHHHHHRQPPASGFFSGDRSAGMNCQDCGNKAKKDCANLRCRSCCNSRGFDCPTHVKSTWVPAAKRRERHHHQEDLRRRQLEIEEEEEEEKVRREKRVRESENINRDNDQTLLHTTNTTSGLEMTQNSALPPEVNSPAMFRCVRVTSTTEDDPEEQFAYQTAVNIGGHVFKGILYDHGPDLQNNNTNYNVAGAAESSSGGSGGGGGAQPNNHLLATTTTSTIGGGGQTAAMLDTNNNRSFIYPTINAFMAGTQFLFPSSRS